jgi:hypothetical protein
VIITPSERRRAEEFEALLEGRSVSADADLSMLSLGSRLRTMDAGGDIDPAFRERLRTRLLAVASVQGIGSDAPIRPSRIERNHQKPQTSRRVPRRIALAAGTVTALVALSGVGAASGTAVPGDTLYSVKRSREAAQLALARSDVSRGQLHLQFARTRLLEAVSVRDDDAALRRALDDMDADTSIAMRELSSAALDRQDRTPLDVVDEFVAVQRRQLIGLISAQPHDRRARALDSLTLLEQMRERSTALRPALLCDGAFLGADTVDELGSLPRRCAALPGVGSGNKPNPDGNATAKPRTGDPSQGPGSVRPPDDPAESGGPSANQPGGPSAPASRPNQPPSLTPGGASGVLGTVTGTVGGVVGGVLGPLAGQPSAPVLP